MLPALPLDVEPVLIATAPVPEPLDNPDDTMIRPLSDAAVASAVVNRAMPLDARALDPVMKDA